ncbi:MAG: 3-deoxy-8-phosphooctulonate synthase [Candidatus Aegiribacteria sp.]|nr:3-deoxy-8-phosphooctulonate synthase [Candidatus Aegiribacteria sp.]MBD3293970.1 3-deoxy-8-phosphooctulonate synthase [Candidatus Fermentibacteria bacterium]
MSDSVCLPVFVTGPCSLESRELALHVADYAAGLFHSLNAPAELYFKGSFLKDNRTSPGSYRGPGIEEGLRILEEVADETGLKTTTDIHSAEQAGPVAEVVDVIQVPAFLCRQTSILEAAGETGRKVNVKKGQFMNPANMKGAVEKVISRGCPEVWLTERGAFFGYGDLVVDFRSLSVMKDFAGKVILDVTHSLQKPGALGSSTGGCREYAPALARAAAAWGVDGLFIETHPDPAEALSDSTTMVDLSTMESMVRTSLDFWYMR